MRAMTRRVAEAKARARRQCLQRRRDMSEDILAGVSAAIASRVVALDPWCRSRTVHSYIGSMAGEVQTQELIRLALDQGRNVIVPVVPPDRGRRLLHARITSPEQDLATGPMGLRQPPAELAGFDDFASLDLIIVPGLAFSSTGHRLGMGGGYYDRFLVEVAAPKIGLVSEQLLLDSIPRTDHDVRMDWVVTEAAIYDCHKETTGA
jgi:5-formyltetrahydrofolate cyclo-ligase